MTDKIKTILVVGGIGVGLVALSAVFFLKPKTQQKVPTKKMVTDQVMLKGSRSEKMHEAYVRAELGVW